MNKRTITIKKSDLIGVISILITVICFLIFCASIPIEHYYEGLGLWFIIPSFIIGFSVWLGNVIAWEHPCLWRKTIQYFCVDDKPV